MHTPCPTTKSRCPYVRSRVRYRPAIVPRVRKSNHLPQGRRTVRGLEDDGYTTTRGRARCWWWRLEDELGQVEAQVELGGRQLQG